MEFGRKIKVWPSVKMTGINDDGPVPVYEPAKGHLAVWGHGLHAVIHVCCVLLVTPDDFAEFPPPLHNFRTASRLHLRFWRKQQQKLESYKVRVRRRGARSCRFALALTALQICSQLRFDSWAESALAGRRSGQGWFLCSSSSLVIVGISMWGNITPIIF